MSSARARRLRAGVTCAAIFAVALWGTITSADPADPADPAPAQADGPAVPEGRDPDGWLGPMPQHGPLRLVSTTELPMSLGWFPTAAPADDGRAVVLYGGEDWYAALRADRPTYTEAELSDAAVRLPGSATDGPVADLAIGEGGSTQAVLGPVDPVSPGRLVRFDTAAGTPPVVTRETPLTGPLDALGDVAPELLADAADAAAVSYVLRTRTVGRSVELTALRAGRISRQVLVELPASADPEVDQLATSPDGGHLVVSYWDGGTLVLASFASDLTALYTTPVPGLDPYFAHTTVDDDGVVRVLARRTDDERARITRLSADGAVDPEQLVVDDHTFVDGVALGPDSAQVGSGRWMFVSGMSDATGVLGVVVVDLTDGRTIAETGFCTDYADGILQPPVVSPSRRMITVVGSCFGVPTVYRLAFDPPDDGSSRTL